MKKFLAVILSVLMLLSFSVTAFADTTTTPSTTPSTSTGTSGSTPALTPAQQQARDAFQQVYMNDMNQLVALRAQTSQVVQQNNNIAGQIKTKMQGLKGQISSDTLAKIKSVVQQDKTLAAQAKSLNQQRTALRQQYRDAIKKNDVTTMQNLEPQILNLTSQINNIRTQIMNNISSIQPLRAQIKTYRDNLAQQKTKMQPLIQQSSGIRSTIKSEQTSKAALWQTFKQNIEAKDYTSAGNTLQSIIAAKTQILSNLNSRQQVLTNILNSFN